MEKREATPAFPRKFSETKIATDHPRWTARAIETRGNELLRFAEGRWDFSLAEWGIKDLKQLLVLP